MKLLLLLLLFANTLWAKTTIVQKSDEIFIQKKRKEALEFLNKNLSKDLENPKIILNRIKKYSEFFYTEKGQKNYETANSYYVKNPKRALEIYTETLVLEPFNLKVLKKIWSLRVRSKSCLREDYDKISEMSFLFGELEDYRILKAYFSYCLWPQKIIFMKNITKAEGLLFNAIYWVTNNESKKAIKLLNKIREKNNGYAELYYWLWKAHNLNVINKKYVDQETDQYVRKYKDVCNRTLSRGLNKYELDPYLCTDKKDWEKKDK